MFFTDFIREKKEYHGAMKKAPKKAELPAAVSGESVTAASAERKISRFFFEAGTLRKIARAHRQALLTDDLTDSISSHSYRVTLIAWHLAKMEKADPYKTVMMALLHDLPEARSNDHNWIHKRYIKMFEDEIRKEQFAEHPFGAELSNIAGEYDKRESAEAKIAKDADLLDQVLLLKEYAWQGNKEAAEWLIGKEEGKRYFTVSAKKLVKEICAQNPSEWWKNLWTSRNK